MGKGETSGEPHDGAGNRAEELERGFGAGEERAELAGRRRGFPRVCLSLSGAEHGQRDGTEGLGGAGLALLEARAPVGSRRGDWELLGELSCPLPGSPLPAGGLGVLPSLTAVSEAAANFFSGGREQE